MGLGYVKGMGKARYAALSPEEWLARRTKLETERKQRARRKKGKRGRRAQRQREEAACFDWARVLPYVQKEESGCWVWLGAFKAVFDVPMPLVTAGDNGRMHAAYVVWGLTNRCPLPPNCFLRPLCGRIECVSPEHNVVTNQVVERAKRRRATHDEEELFRARQGRDDRGRAAAEHRAELGSELRAERGESREP